MKIAGVGSAVPEKIVTNDMLSEFIDTSDEWISSRTGIRERRLVSSEQFEDLAVKAAQNALKDSGVLPEKIDLLLCTTVISPYVTPALACIIREKLGINCASMDVNGACAGFIYALDIAQAYIDSAKAKNILIVSAENLSRLVDFNDRSTCVLFGDGAGAAVVCEGKGVESIVIRTTDSGDALVARMSTGNNPYLDNPIAGHYLKMDGKGVFRKAIAASIEDINEALSKSGESSENIDHFILHQANMRIIKSIYQRLELPPEKFKHNIERYGNTSSASIPILIDELYRSGELKKGDKLVLSAFGAGFVSGACVLEWNK